MFKRKPKAPNEAEFRGPLDLVPGDRVLYYQQELTLAGVVFLAKVKERRCQYHFLDEDERHVVLAWGPGADPVITLERPLPEDEHPDSSGESFEMDGTEFCLDADLDARAFSLGGIPSEKGTAAKCRIYQDEDEMEFLVVEDWGGYVEVRRGESIHENELVVKRQRDEEDWDIKPPPRIDLRSLNEARRDQAMAVQAKQERQRATDMASARAKLAAFQDDAPTDEDADAVSLSEIVDVQHRFPDEEPGASSEDPGETAAAEAGAEEPMPEEEPAPVGTADDPFANVFDEEEETAKAEDPYQAYMEEDEPEPVPSPPPAAPPPPVVESEPLFPETEPGEDVPVDEERAEFLSAGIFGDDEDDDLI